MEEQREIGKLERCINDLVSVLALPASWGSGEPLRIANRLGETLLEMLHLDLVCVQLRGSTGWPPIDVLRLAPGQQRAPGIDEVCTKIGRSSVNGIDHWPAVLRASAGDGEIAIVPRPLGLDGEMGVIAAGSKRSNFPDQTENLLLSVAANQALVGLQQAQLLAEQRRMTAELDARIAQRTQEMARANEELRAEIEKRAEIEESLRIERSELRRSEARSKAIVDSSLDCLVAIDHLALITEFNPAAERTFGYRRDEVIGRSLSEVLIPPSLRERHRKGFARYLATGVDHVLGRRMELMGLCKDGREIPVELTISRIALPGPPSFTGYIRDITARKQSEEAIREAHAQLARSEERWRSVFENSAVGVALADLSGRYLAANPVFQQMVGYSEEELRSLSFLDITLKDYIERNRELVAELIAGKREHFQIEKQCRRRDGTFVWVRNHVSIVPGSDRVPRFLMAISEDTSERRQAGEALARARAELAHVARVTSLGVLTASIAHELNQPLAGIVTNASTCVRMLDGDPPNIDGARETARRTIRDGNRASDILTRLRTLFRRKEIVSEAVDLNDAAREVIALSLTEWQSNHVILRQELADDLPLVQGDRVQLQQVILNLLRNASDAMTTVDDRPRDLLVRTEREGPNWVRLSVRDAGIGFDPQLADRLFERFFTTKVDGMGIGLSVTRSIIEAHQGKLSATLNGDAGSTFAFSIPCGELTADDSVPAPPATTWAS